MELVSQYVDAVTGATSGVPLKVAADGTILVSSLEVVASANPVGSVSPAYSAGDVVGGVLSFASALPAFSGGVGLLQSIKITCKSVQTAGFKLYLFSANPSNTTWTDNAAPNMNVADLPNLLGVYSLTGNDSGLGTMTIYNLDGIGKVVNVNSSTTLYGVLVTTGTPTLTSTTDISVALGILL